MPRLLQLSLRLLPPASLALGLFLYGQPGLVENSVSHLKTLGSFLLFISFFGALFVGVFRVVARVLPFSTPSEQVFQAVAFGSLGLAWITGWGAWIVSPGVHWKWPTISVLFLLLAWGMGRPIQLFRGHVPAAAWWTGGIVLLAITLRVLGGFQIHGHGDAFITYLSAPRVWFDTGSLRSFQEVSSFFLSGLWENLTLWGNVLLAGRPGEGLDAVQRFAQWVSAGIGMGGLAVSLFLILEKAQPSEHKISQTLLWIAVLAGISVPSTRWMASLAKHDIGVAFWMLAGVLFFLRGRIFVASVFMGAATISKLSVVMLPVALVGFGYFYFRREKSVSFVKYLGFALFGGLLGALPILARNLVFTGNPVFPFANGLFPSDLIPASRLASFANATAVPSFSWSAQFGYLSEAFWAQPWIVFCFLPLVPFWGWPVFPRTLRYLCGTGVGAFILFNLFLRPQTEIRYHAPTLALLGALGIFVAFLLVAECSRRFRLKRFREFGYALVFGTVIATSGMPLFLLPRLLSGRLDAAPTALQRHTGGEPKQWIRRNAPLGSRVLHFGDDEIYYLLSHGATVAQYSNTIDPILGDPDPSVQARFERFHRAGFRFAYFYRGPWSISHPRYNELWETAGGREDCLTFESDVARIVDLECISRVQNH